MNAWMYILKCVDDSYYIGSTKDLNRRIHEHKKGYCYHTSQRLPVELVYTEVYKSINYAKKREMQIKGWTRKKKETLVKEELKLLHELAICKNATSYLNNCPSAPLRTGSDKTK